MLWSSSPTTNGAPPPAILLEQRGPLFEHPDRQRQQVLEVEHPHLATLALVGPKQADAGPHQLRFVSVLGCSCPDGQALQRNQLLLEALQHLERRRHQVVGPFVSSQG